jgi:hypothetical protein
MNLDLINFITNLTFYDTHSGVHARITQKHTRTHFKEI